MFKKSLIIAVVGFVAGYLTNHLLQDSAAEVEVVKSTQQDCEQPPLFTETVAPETPLSQPTASASSIASQAATVAPHKNANAINSGHEPTELPAEQTLPQAENTPVSDVDSGDVKNPDVITDAEIDAVLPAPFNQRLKGMQGYFRDKYKEFAFTEKADDWDVKMKGYIEDFIYSHAYGKNIIIESLACKTGICEIRLYETKEGIWPVVLAEMRLQSWWEAGEMYSGAFATQLNSVDIIGHYVLIDRKRN